MKRLKNILLVYDAEKQSRAALKRAVNLAKRNEAILTVVMVHKEFPPEMQMAVPSSDIDDFHGEVEQESSKHLKKGHMQLTQLHTNYCGRQCVSHPR